MLASCPARRSSWACLSLQVKSFFFKKNLFWIKTIPDRLHAFLPMRCGGTSVDCQPTLRAAGTSSPDSSSNASASRKNSGGRRTIAMMHKSNQLIMRVVSLFLNNWVVACAGQRDSSLKGNSALRPYGARAAGVDLAHGEGHFVIHFFWEMKEFHGRTKAHFLTPLVIHRASPF